MDVRTTANGAKRTLAERGLPDLGLSSYLMRQWRVRAAANLVECRGRSTSTVTPSNLDGAARAETDQDQILDGPHVKRFLA
jgi:hypothetical protein